MFRKVELLCRLSPSHKQLSTFFLPSFGPVYTFLHHCTISRVRELWSASDMSDATYQPLLRSKFLLFAVFVQVRPFSNLMAT